MKRTRQWRNMRRWGLWREFSKFLAKYFPEIVQRRKKIDREITQVIIDKSRYDFFPNNTFVIRHIHNQCSFSPRLLKKKSQSVLATLDNIYRTNDDRHSSVKSVDGE